MSSRLVHRSITRGFFHIVFDLTICSTLIIIRASNTNTQTGEVVMRADQLAAEGREILYTNIGTYTCIREMYRSMDE